MASHFFAVGQKVRLKTSRTQPGSKDVYTITAVLPVLGTLPQYRIRNEAERHERVTTEDQLVTIQEPPEMSPAPAATTPEGENSMAKGQQRKTKEVRKPKKDAKAAKVETGFSVQMKRAESSMTKPGKK
jgi:hypothetical protein